MRLSTIKSDQDQIVCVYMTHLDQEIARQFSEEQREPKITRCLDSNKPGSTLSKDVTDKIVQRDVRQVQLQIFLPAVPGIITPWAINQYNILLQNIVHMSVVCLVSLAVACDTAVALSDMPYTARLFCKH